ncbi:MAG: hypothetical protein JNJ57_06000 [Saprospiraceae bacterium]|nr:hypothetical protein [Saprospiraceae bacterium]
MEKLFSKGHVTLGAGLALILITAWFSVGYHHPDEHYQILEFAKYKLGESPLADLPWEYHEKMRPGLQPFLAFAGIKFLRILGAEDPFLIAFFFRLLTGLLIFWLYWKWSEKLSDTLSNNGKWLKAAWMFFWMMPYLNVRFSSENLSAFTFFGGLLILLESMNKKRYWHVFAAGFVLCLSFFFRYQIAFAAIGLGIWLVYYRKLQAAEWMSLMAGALVAFLPGLAADYWLYGSWEVAPYNYFVQNIVEDKAAGFGVSPWWTYFSEFPLSFLPPISLFLFGFLTIGILKQPKHVFVWCLVPFVLCHSAIAHKEIRFMFPMLLPMFYLAAYGMDQIKWQRWLRGLFKFSIGINMLALTFRCLYPANDIFTYTRFLRRYASANPETVVYQEPAKNGKKDRLVPHFYQSPWVQIIIPDSLKQLNNKLLYHPEKGDLLLIKDPNTSITFESFRLEKVYQWYPDWLLGNNLNGWQDRTRIWNVYRIQ